MWRTLPFDFVASDSRLINLFTKIPPDFKLNTKIFRKALEFISPHCSKVIESNTGAKPNSGTIVKIFESIKQGVIQKTRHKPTLDDELAGNGSWINWTVYVRHSEVLRNLWTQSAHEHADFFNYLIGENPFERPYFSWADNHHLFARILTLSLWLDNRVKSE